MHRTISSRKASGGSGGYAMFAALALAALAGTAIYVLRSEKSPPRRVQPSTAPGVPQFDRLKSEWMARSESLEAERRATAGWSSRYDDALRIARNVEHNLDRLRIAEARKEPAKHILESLAGDEREWSTLVEGRR